MEGGGGQGEGQGKGKSLGERAAKVMMVVENAKILGEHYEDVADKCSRQCAKDVVFLGNAHEQLVGISDKIKRQDECLRFLTHEVKVTFKSYVVTDQAEEAYQERYTCLQTHLERLKSVRLSKELAAVGGTTSIAEGKRDVTLYDYVDSETVDYLNTQSVNLIRVAKVIEKKIREWIHVVWACSRQLAQMILSQGCTMNGIDQRVEGADSLLRMQNSEYKSIQGNLQPIRSNCKDICSRLGGQDSSLVTGVAVAAAEKYTESLSQQLSKMYDSLQRIMNISSSIDARVTLYYQMYERFRYAQLEIEKLIEKLKFAMAKMQQLESDYASVFSELKTKVEHVNELAERYEGFFYAYPRLILEMDRRRHQIQKIMRIVNCNFNEINMLFKDENEKMSLFDEQFSAFLPDTMFSEARSKTFAKLKPPSLEEHIQVFPEISPEELQAYTSVSERQMCPGLFNLILSTMIYFC
eukprot:Nk52_evm32s1020 gene=Nk52_evmTU32s1020